MTAVELTPRRLHEPSLDDLQRRSDLSRSQLLMWLGQEIDPDVPLYNMIQTFRFDGPIDIDGFRAAWRSVVSRSDSLRTCVSIVDGVPMRTVNELPTGDLEVVDLHEADDPELDYGRWVDDRKLRSLDMSDRLWDTALVLLADDVSTWYLCQHHLITDGQSFAVVYRNMADAYQLAIDGSLTEAPALPAYGDYLRYAQEIRDTRGWAKASAYWTTSLDRGGDPPTCTADSLRDSTLAPTASSSTSDWTAADVSARSRRSPTSRQ